VSIPFDAIAGALLAQAETLVPQWLPHGKRRGREWVCGDLYGEVGDSCSVNLQTGLWRDFASDEGGRDLISLFAAIHSIGQGTAAKQLADLTGVDRETRGPPPAPRPVAAPEPTDPAPAGTEPSPMLHRDHGEPSAAWLYEAPDGRPWVWIARYDPPEGRKQIVPWTWDGQRWRAKGAPVPRPLFTLPAPARRPTAKILIVEGEKAAVAAAELLSPAWVVTTWQGGAAAVAKADWSPLTGRDVTIWPDHDGPGFKAGEEIIARLRPVASNLRVIDTTGEDIPECWHAADALSGGRTRETCGPWAQARVKPVTFSPPEPAPAPAADDPATEPAPVAEPPAAPEPAPEQPKRPRGKPNLGLVDHGGNVVPKTSDPEPEPEMPESAALGRLNLGLATNAKQNPHCNIDNAVRILAHHPQWKDAIYYDSFSQRVMWKDDVGRVKPWDDADDLRLTVWMQRALGLPDMLDIVVHKAVSARAHECQRNPLTGWLNGLTWDGEDRLLHLMPDGFGSVRNAYTEAVGRCFAVSLVARAFEPGCKADNMIVLEGPQGGGKTTALEILGGEWYSEMHEAITGKDFLQNLEGKWLVEISEMHSFSRADVKRVKGIISGRNDYYRASYGRRSQDHPRGCIFAGTTNRDDWNEDETGARRFFPVNCIEINIDWIRSNRDQLFAEAVARFRRQESWSDIPLQDARSEQEARRNVDEWESVIRRYVAESPHADPGGAVTWYPRDAPLRETTVGDVLREALQIPEGKWNRADQMRVASALRLAGFVRVSRGGRKMWANRADRILEQQDLAI